MFSRAKNESEPDFVRAVRNMMLRGLPLFGLKILSVRACTEDEDKSHGDVAVALDTGKLDVDDSPIAMEIIFDVKDQEESNRGRTTYCVSNHEMADILANREKYSCRYFACVEYARAESGWAMAKTGRFLCCPAYYLGRAPSPAWLVRKDSMYLIDLASADGRFALADPGEPSRGAPA